MKLAQWVLLVLLTLLIFLYPARLTPESHPLESMHIFNNLPLFSVLYFAWFALLLVLAFSHGEERTQDLEKVMLVCVFTLVFAGLWVSLRQSYAGDAAREASNIAYLNHYGQIPLTGQLYRADFPGAAILGSAVSQVTGLADFDVLTVLSILQILLFPALLYFVSKSAIKDSRWAALMVLLAITGNAMITTYLARPHPASYAIFLLFTPFLLLLIRSQGPRFGCWQSSILFLLLLLTTTITHFVTAICFLLVLMGVFIMQRLNRKNLVTLSTVALSAVILLSWEMYGAITFFGSYVKFMPKMIDDLSQGLFFSQYAAVSMSPEVRETMPLWANITKYFWLALIFVLGATLGFKNLIQLRRLNDVETKITGGLVGTGLLFIITVLGSPMDWAYRYRILLYAPFFTVPIVAIFTNKLRQPLKKYSFAALATLLLVFSFPTFLAHNNTVSTTAYYAYETSGYWWLKSQYGDKEEVYLAGGWHLLDYYIEGTQMSRVGLGLQWMVEENAPSYVESIDKQLTLLQDKGNEAARLFIFPESRIVGASKHLWGTDPATLPEWEQLKSRLSKEELIYDNGYMKFYQNK